ncbi:hypothetical protein [Microbacterium sp.]|uniref:hypothetical protein n=1 Tax=Microbacterium sp. TaxID=51671 RepID=UPI0039E65F10
MNNAIDSTPDPRGMLDLMSQTRRATVRRQNRRYAGLVALWAVAWAVGFGALWATRDVGALTLLSPAAGWIAFAASLVVAIVVSFIVGVAAAHDGVRGPSHLQGALYGCSWPIAMIAASLLLGGLQRNGMPPELANLAYPGIYIFLVGVIYLVSGALWRAVPMYLLGAALILTTVVATFAGTPTHYLIYATVAPAAMLVVAALMLWGPLRGDGQGAAS